MRRPLIMLLAALTAFTLIGGIATATVKSGSAHACVSGKGALVLLHKGKCPTHTSAITIGKQGPKGPKGKPGPVGPAVVKIATKFRPEHLRRRPNDPRHGQPLDSRQGELPRDCHP